MHDTVASQLIDSTVLDSSWDAPIMFRSTVWYPVDPKQTDSLCINQSDTPIAPVFVNIVHLLKTPSQLNIALLEHHLKYPKFCSFKFEGYSDARESVLLLKNDVIAAARKGGQQLAIRHSTSTK